MPTVPRIDLRARARAGTAPGPEAATSGGGPVSRAEHRAPARSETAHDSLGAGVGAGGWR